MLKRITKVSTVTLILVIVLALNVEASDEFPISIVDDLGREVVINSKAERVVSLAPNITEILYALGVEDRIVGVSEVCDYPEGVEEKARVSHNSLESILAQEPDVVIGAGITPKEVINSLEDLGVYVLGFAPESIDQTLGSIERIGVAIGDRQRANELSSQLQKEFKEISSKVEEVVDVEGRVKVFYEVWEDPLYTAGDNTYIDDLIVRAGGENIGAKAQGPWPQYSKEMLLIEDPQVYIATYESSIKGTSVGAIKARKNYSEISAIKDGRIYIFDPNIINRSGPRVIEALRLFVEAIHPQINLEE
ncbi:ABC transporter substrate-binding protein [Halonatronum saccharophilum]|uniref:ABC transporter substrate-binding protein n=1 Tax=Halonatronum saccharophilum TaxID=150060 RepID=UPI0004808DA4|nr:helical backbone metal receptor [Halonatronum saccharophilum]